MTKSTEQECRRGTRRLAAAAVTGSVGPENIEPELLALSRLSRVDYADHFVLAHESAGRVSAERWARTMFGDTPDLVEKLLWSRARAPASRGQVGDDDRRLADHRSWK